MVQNGASEKRLEEYLRQVRELASLRKENTDLRSFILLLAEQIERHKREKTSLNISMRELATKMEELRKENRDLKVKHKAFQKSVEKREELTRYSELPYDSNPVIEDIKMALELQVVALRAELEALQEQTQNHDQIIADIE